MPIKATYTRFLVGRYDLSGDSNQLELDINSNAIEYNVFQTPAQQSIAGVPDAKLTVNGYYNGPDTGDMEERLYTMLANESAPRVAAVLGTNQPIPVAYVLPSTYNSQLNIATPVNNLITLQGLWPTKTSQLYRGYQLWAGAVTATGTKTGVDFGSAGAAGGTAWLFATASAGGSVVGATVDVESDDNSGFTTATSRGTFALTGLASHEISLATVERYMRINTTDPASATSITFTVIVAVPGVTY